MQTVNKVGFDSPALPFGKPLSLPEFKNWIGNAEKATTLSLEDAKSQWAIKRNHLQKIHTKVRANT